MPSNRKLSILLLIIAITVLCIFFIFKGQIHLLMSLWMYFLVFYGTIQILFWIIPSFKKSNFRISYWVIFIGVLTIELSLRFITQSNLSYSEKNGSLWYYDYFKQSQDEDVMEQGSIGKEEFYAVVPGDSCRYENKPEFSYSYCYNKYGFREREYSQEDLDNSLVILGMGDSFTEGIGAPPDSTWTALLQMKLQINQSSIKVINCGKSGSDLIYDWYKIKTDLIEIYQPDIVIYNLNSSDLYDLIFKGGKDRFNQKKKYSYLKAPWWNTLYGISHITRLVVHELFNIRWHLFTDKQFSIEQQKVASVINNFVQEELIPLASTNSYNQLLLFTPTKYEIENDILFLQHTIDSLNQENINIRCLNLLDTFRYIYNNEGNLNNYYWEQDMHCTPEGYNVWAVSVRNELLENGWIKSSHVADTIN